MSSEVPRRDGLGFFRQGSNPSQRDVVFNRSGSAGKVDDTKSTKELCGIFSATARTSEKSIQAYKNSATSAEQVQYFSDFWALVNKTAGKVNTLTDITLSQKTSVTSSSGMYTSSEVAGKDYESVSPGASKG